MYPLWNETEKAEQSPEGGELLSDESTRRYSQEFKTAALARLGRGENVSALARELGVLHKRLYQWWE